MSADLFAEFNDLSNTPPPPPRQSTQYQPPQPQTHSQTQAPNKDPFDFFQSQNASSVAPQPTAVSGWSSFSPQPASTITPPAAVDAPVEDDDGWGDFETADSAGQAPAFDRAPSTSTAIPWQSPPSTSTSSPAPGPGVASASPKPMSMGWQSSFPDPTPAPAPAPVQWPTSSAVPPISTQGPTRTRIIRASTFDLMANNLVNTGEVIEEPEPQSSQISWGQLSGQQRAPKPKSRLGRPDSNMLFDADDFELQSSEEDEEDEDDDDDDDFGDFETVAPPAPPPKPIPVKAPAAPPSMDLLSLDEPSPPDAKPAPQKQHPSQLLGALSFAPASANYPQAPKSPSFQDRNPFPELAIKTPTTDTFSKDDKAEESPVTAWPTLDEPSKPKAGKGKSVPNPTNKLNKGNMLPEAEAKTDDDDWGAWDDTPAEDRKGAVLDTSRPAESWDWDAVDNVQPASQPEIKKEDVAPPINVPPPSIVLSVFPDLLNSGDALFKPISGQTASIKQRILSDPKAVDFLEGYVLLAVTAARVIAGRKQRWHRDKILAKSMSISAAGSKGMKLAGVDKTQSAREDREAADVVAVWKQQVGRLRSAVAAAKAAGKLDVKVPEISENMHVHTAKMVPTAPKACIICGLKREERIAKVDYEVEDSFGEWWADHWGHKACKNFWIEHEQKLRQR